MINATTASARTDLKSRAFDIGNASCEPDVLIFHLLNFLFLVLALFDFSSLRTHFWPFTEVLRKIWRLVTRKVAETHEPRMTRMSRMDLQAV